MINAALEAETGKPLADEVITARARARDLLGRPARRHVRDPRRERPRGRHAEGGLDRRAVRPAPAQRAARGAGDDPSRQPGSARTSRDLLGSQASGVAVGRRGAGRPRAEPARPELRRRHAGPAARAAPTRRAHRARRQALRRRPARARRHRPRHRAGRVRLPARRVGLRQVDAAEPDRGARPARRPGSIETPADGRGRDVPGVGAHAVAHRPAQRRAGAAAARASPRARAPRRRRSRCSTP